MIINKDINSAIVLQPFGIGDILFISPLLKKYWGYDLIVFPVNDEYIWIAEYLKYNNVKFIEQSKFNGNMGMFSHIFQFRYADMILGNGIDCMSAKYKLVNCPVDEWRTLSWERKIEKEKDLFYNVLGLRDGEPYILINNNFANPSMQYKTGITVDTDVRIIEMAYIDGFTLLEWGMVIENSSEFHTVSTSTFYMVEYLNVSNTKLHLYPRYGIDTDLSPIRPIIDTNKWNLHE